MVSIRDEGENPRPRTAFDTLARPVRLFLIAVVGELSFSYMASAATLLSVS